MFLVETTWLALTIWVSEHGPLLGAVALTGLQARAILSRSSVRA